MSFFQINKIAPNFFNPIPILFCVAIIQKMLITAVHGFEPEGMFDGTPMLLGACRDFLDVGNRSVDIAAVSAVQSFDGVEITKVAAIQNDVITPLDFGNTISWKTKELIGARPKIHECHRYDA